MPDWGLPFLLGCCVGGALGVAGCLLVIAYEEAQWEEWFRSRWR